MHVTPNENQRYRPIITSKRNLGVIVLTDSTPDVVDDTLRDIGIGLSLLKELIIEECVLVTDEGIIALFDYMPPLESNLYIDEKDSGPHGWKKM